MTLIQHQLLVKLLTGIGIALTTVFAGQVFAQDSASLATATADYEVAAIERVFDGTVEAVHQATVSAQTGGRISELNYDVDDYVEVGSVLVRFTDEEQQAALRQTEAQLLEARARSTEAEEE
jgi:multidrug efflux pump subunit AcrA (membrane-fusion protein)